MVMGVGIIGLGFVGDAMYESFTKRVTEDIKCIGYDKYKNGGIGTFEEVCQCDIVFLALPTPFDESTKCYDTSALNSVCGDLAEIGFEGTVVIKSTVEPGTTVKFSEKYGLSIIHNPEFLTARTAYEDFDNQDTIILGIDANCSSEKYELVAEFYTKLYPNAKIIKCDAKLSEIVKIGRNNIFAMKVQVFTEMYKLCEFLEVEYSEFRSILLDLGWLNPMHTVIPGPDGNISYGGMCFPKDTNALLNFMKNNDLPCQVLEAVVKERDIMRDGEKM